MKEKKYFNINFNIFKNIRYYSLQRWLDILLLVFFAGAAALCISPLLAALFDKMHKVYDKVIPIIFYIFLYMLSVGLWCLIKQLKGFDKGQLIFSYPPAWVAGIFGMTIIIGFQIYYFFLYKSVCIKGNIQILMVILGFSTCSFNSIVFYVFFLPVSIFFIFSSLVVSLPFNLAVDIYPAQIAASNINISSYLNETGFIAIIISLTGFGLLFLAVNQLSAKPKKTKTVIEKHKPLSIKDLTTKEQILEWIEDEEPVNTIDEDLLNRTPYVERITKILKSQKTSSIGIIGGYGMGKTSIINMVDNKIKEKTELKHDDKTELFEGEIITCRADSWGRENNTIAKQILKIAINKISEKADVLSIASVPDNYLKAMSGSKNPMLGICGNLLGSQKEPEELLEKIDFILKAINKRLVIYIEDIDRNTKDQHINEELPALLDRITKIENINFVLAIGAGKKNMSSVIRVCEHLEYLV